MATTKKLRLRVNVTYDSQNYDKYGKNVKLEVSYGIKSRNYDKKWKERSIMTVNLKVFEIVFRPIRKS